MNGYSDIHSDKLCTFEFWFRVATEMHIMIDSRVPTRHYDRYPLENITVAKYGRVPLNVQSSLQLEGTKNVPTK